MSERTTISDVIVMLTNMLNENGDQPCLVGDMKDVTVEFTTGAEADCLEFGAYPTGYFLISEPQ